MSTKPTILSRRKFLQTSAFAAAGLGLSAKSWGRVVGANDTIRVGVIGFHGRGNALIDDALKAIKDGENARITALCDVDSTVLAKGVEAAHRRDEPVKGFKDLRDMYASKEVDAVIIATPNHWHALATVWACQAGLDVYTEKPVSNNVFEGRKMVEAARKYERIVQTGTQSRSSSGILEAIEWVRAGNLGKIKIARGLCYKPRPSIGKTSGDQPVPEGIDYDLWCGPAPLTQPRRNNKSNGPVHYDWHWFWNYGAGDLGNQGIHQMDIARWFLGHKGLSPRVLSFGGRLGYEDDGETPNTQVVYHDFPGAPLIFEVRGLPEKKGAKEMDKYRGGSVAVIIECEGGDVLVPNYNSATAVDKAGKEIQKWSGTSNHMANFFKAVRSRKVSDLKADILEGHLSSALCHTGNISYRLGQKTGVEGIRSALKGHNGAGESFDRMLSHLRANEVDVAKDMITLGPVLTMDPKKETFPGNAKANALLTREYRKPFVVPNKV